MTYNFAKLRSLMAVFGLVSLLAVQPTPAAAEKNEGPPSSSHDGLELVPGTEVAMAYVKPGADFSGYKRLMILDTYVAFQKGWAERQRRSSVNKVSNRDIERMKKDLAELFREVFIERLDIEGGYPVVQNPDSDVLLLRPAIIDLEVTVPDVHSSGRSYNFAASAGAATLFLELYDSVSGEILARILDRKSAGNTGDFMRWSNQVSNRAAARRVLGEWAGLLRQRLDEIHGNAE
jgi:hypothetical protein